MAMLTEKPSSEMGMARKRLASSGVMSSRTSWGMCMEPRSTTGSRDVEAATCAMTSSVR